MKRLIVALLAFGVVAGPAFANNDYVYVNYNDNRERINGLDMDTLSVCELKRLLASEFGLNIRKFHLTRPGGSRLREGKTLAEESIRHAGRVAVKEVSASTQCT